MKTQNLGMSGLKVPVIAVGCMRIDAISKEEAYTFINTALDLGANFFDHADIYGDGCCEEFFSCALTRVKRQNIIIQTKCGIKKGKAFDFSKKHIINSTEQSLKRLRTDYIDVLLLHRPDILMEGEEVAEAFGELHAAGKVRHFGVSNQNTWQMEYLRKYVKQPLIANQLQFSIAHSLLITEGIYVNMTETGAVNRTGGILDYCRIHDITIQAWSPFQFGYFGGVFLDNPKFSKVNTALKKIAKKYNVSATTIAVAWILRHPAKIQPVIGTMKESRLKESIKAAEITLTREEWYDIYQAAGNKLP